MFDIQSFFVIQRMGYELILVLVVWFHFLVYSHGHGHSELSCRSYCGNLTIDYPFALRSGCGHPGFRDLLYCINDVVMFHINSGSYRVLDIDYAYQSLTLHDPHMSTCDSIVLGNRGNGFVMEQWREPYLNPSNDNVFMLIGCSPGSPLFQGFPGKHLVACHDRVSGMGCEEYYGCPAWNLMGRTQRVGSSYGSGPPECCAVSYEAVKAVNLSKLDCQGYSSAYSLAPLKVSGPDEWSYGIRVKYSVRDKEVFCKACEATGGSCGFNMTNTIGNLDHLCMCGTWNSSSNCDSSSGDVFIADQSASNEIRWSLMEAFLGFIICQVLWGHLQAF